LLGTYLGQQPEHGQAKEETIDVAAPALAKRGSECVALWRGEAFDAIDHRRAQAVQRGIRKVLLRFHAPGSCDPHTGGTRHSVVEQRRLAEARLAAQHQGLPMSPACALEQAL
jgi:hypothetical protein